VDAISGQVECLISVISSGAPHVQAGKLRGLAVTSSTRASILPDVPTIAESGYPGFEATGWLGLLFSAKTPEAIVNRVAQEAVAVINMPQVRDQLQKAGLDPHTSDPAAFQAYIKTEFAKWAKVIKDAGIKAR
jgi:tripartite-type tricarboxylate transporter receptor subunit TctC